MLKFFSRMERTRNFVLLVFAILMVVSLIFFYAPTRGDVAGNLTRNEETVAKVGSEQVTVADVALQQETMRQNRQPMPSKTMLNQIIGQRLIRIEANRLGLGTSDTEVASFIRQQFKTPDAKPFDQKRYEQNVTDQYGSVQNFEQSVRDQLSAQKLDAFLTSGVTVSEDEVLGDFRRKNTKFDLSYVPVTSADLAQTIKPTDEELKSYFEQNKKNYYISVPQKKIRYIFLNTSKIGEKQSFSDEDLRAEYEKIPADKKQAGVQGQQIVLRVPKPELESQILQKANEISLQAKKDGDQMSEEAFTELVKGYSEDAASKANGGKLAGLVKENPKNPTDPYQRLLKMQPNEVTEPIKYQDRYFILRRGEAVPKTFEDARKEIEVSLRNRRAYNVAAELAQKVADRLKESKDIQKTAEEFAAQANMSASEMVRETGFVKPGDTVENIGNSPQFEEGIAGLENISDVGEKIAIQNGFAIPMLVEKSEPRDAEFEDVKVQVAETVKIEQARARVGDIANQIAASASGAGNLAAAAASKGLKAQDAKTFILGSPLGTGPSAATSEALEDAIYNLKAGEVTKTPVMIGDNWYIVGVNSREDASMEEFAKERDGIIQQKLSEKRGQVFSDYVGSLRREMEAKGDIKIYQDALAKLDEVSDTQTPQNQGIPPELQQQIQQQMEQQQKVPPPSQGN
ncbi:MAG: SurA N-terminal domain-containing protein [Acidobacteria bacterium]|jgi:peptidyl-prolyl cis-trans isomerase D|nr:SurA N-terminal domain-containing protein [Acidobacteriota bacterium]